MLPRCPLAILLTLAASPLLGQCVGGVCLLPGGGRAAAGAGWHAPSAPVPDAGLTRRLGAATVRIVHHVGRGQSIGSGAVVEKTDRAALVLTCGHLFREGIGKVVVISPDQSMYDARVLAVDSAWDVAVLLIAAPVAPALPLASLPPSGSETLAYCGYGPQGRFASGAGRLLGYVRMQGTPSADTLQLAGAARQGDSGGPIVNARGQVVGVIVGTDGRIVIGPSCRPIARLLARFRALLRQRPRNQDSPNQNDEPRGRKTGSDEAHVPQRSDQARAESAGAAPKASAGAPNSEIHNSDPEIRTSPNSEFGTPHLKHAELVTWLLPLVLTGLGVSVPPTTVLVALHVAGYLRRSRLRRICRRRRRLRDRKPQSTDDKPAVDNAAAPSAEDTRCPSPNVVLQRQLNDDYAGQLASVFAYGGQSPLQDATLGREYRHEIDRAAQSSDAKRAQWAKELRDRVMRRFHRIHGWSPSPAEPPHNSDL